MTNPNNGDLSEVREILRDIAQRQSLFQRQLEEAAATAQRAAQVAESNARSIQAWEALIEQNQVEAEEERSQLRVELNELKQASRENIAQHMDFRERFDRVMGEIADLRRRTAG